MDPPPQYWGGHSPVPPRGAVRVLLFFRRASSSSSRSYPSVTGPDLFISTIYSRRKWSGLFVGLQLLQLPDTAVPPAGTSPRVRWLCGRRAAVPCSQPRVELSHANPLCNLSTPAAFRPELRGLRPPLDPTPCPSLPGSSHTHAGRGSRLDGAPEAALPSLAAASPSFSQLLPVPQEPGEVVGERGCPSPGLPSSPAPGATCPTSRRGMSIQLRAGR